MADVITFQRFWQRRDTAANWTATNPVLAAGEFGVETDTDYFKLGDGSTAWNSLTYVPRLASQLPYNNASSGLAATEVQAAIDELASGGGGGGGANPFAETLQSWDFIGEGVITSTNVGTSFLTNEAVPVVYTGGVGAGASISSAAGAPGICVITTGTTTTGRAGLFFCPPCILLGSGEIAFRVRIRMPTLSDGTDSFTARVALINAINGATQRISASYVHSTNSGQWVADAADGVGTTTTNTTVAPAANTWMVLELRPNAAGTAWTLYVGADTGSLASAGTVSANIPAVALGLFVQITKSAGTNARTIDVDLGTFRQSFTATR